MPCPFRTCMIMALYNSYTITRYSIIHLQYPIIYAIRSFPLTWVLSICPVSYKFSKRIFIMCSRNLYCLFLILIINVLHFYLFLACYHNAIQSIKCRTLIRQISVKKTNKIILLHIPYFSINFLFPSAVFSS